MLDLKNYLQQGPGQIDRLPASCSQFWITFPREVAKFDGKLRITLRTLPISDHASNRSSQLQLRRSTDISNTARLVAYTCGQKPLLIMSELEHFVSVLLGKMDDTATILSSKH